MRILFVASEVAPFSKTGGLADVAKALPAALAKLGHDVLVVTPRYGEVSEVGLDNLAATARVELPSGARTAAQRCRPLSARHRVVFLEEPSLYARPGLYGTAQGDHADNALRFGFLALGSLAAAEALQFEPDVVHLNDWQTGLAAAAQKTLFQNTAVGRARSVFTIHNLAYQGLFEPTVLGELGLPASLFHPEGLEFYGRAGFLKAGLVYSDALTTVSKRYAEEIQTPRLGCGLEGLLQARRGALMGILNGVDYSEWDPAHDGHIAARYSADALGGKTECKRDLRQRCGFRRSGDRPLFGIVSRLVPQKGIGLMLEVLPRLLARADVELVMLGNGDRRFEQGFEALALRHPERVAVEIGFNDAMSHQVEAGADFFLMPSEYEPCGLNQMYSLRYGTPPIVHATGGLDDTVQDAASAQGNGFKFEHHLPSGLEWAIGEAQKVYARPERLAALRRVGMRQNFSWEVAAGKYLALYGAPR